MLFSYNTERFNHAYAKVVCIFNKILDVLPAKQLLMNIEKYLCFYKTLTTS